MRLEPVEPQKLSDVQRPLFEQITKKTAEQKMGFVMSRPDGALVGPFNAFLHFPQFGQAAWNVKVALSEHTTLPKPVHELIILVTGARFSSRYEIYAHEDVARHAGLSAAKISTLASGNRPAGLSHDECVAFDATSVLMRGAQLPESTYQAALSAFGAEGLAELIFLAGFYCLISVVLNGYDAAVPGRAEISQTIPRATMSDLELNRREVVSGMLAAGSVVLMPSQGTMLDELLGPGLPTGLEMIRHADVTLQINGTAHRLSAIPVNTTLLDCLRDLLHLTGSKKGCALGQCGACTVLVDGQRMNGCLLLVVMLEGKQITTIEGLAVGEQLHPLQAAFIEHDAFQCGYCTSGQIMSGVACIAEGHTGSDDEIREWISSNLCRCGAYTNIVAAVRETARRGRQEQKL